MRQKPGKCKHTSMIPYVRMRMRLANATKWITPCSDSCEFKHLWDCRIRNFTTQAGFHKENKPEGVRKPIGICLHGSIQIAHRVSHTHSHAAKIPYRWHAYVIKTFYFAKKLLFPVCLIHFYIYVELMIDLALCLA